ncbi:MAG TPA: hypothetical protein VNZ56_14215 [Verrucomicrobiae bacterium]|jgi:hypothetical protein|nr:hypothetical protein [Verrucomicrobiae bacterium]
MGRLKLESEEISSRREVLLWMAMAEAGALFPARLAGSDHCGFPAAELQAINRGNAERLFPRLKA